MTFDQALDAMWRYLPGWTFVLRSSGDNAAFMARIRSRDYDEWVYESDWCGTPAEAILEARDRAVGFRLEYHQNTVRLAKKATGETE